MLELMPGWGDGLVAVSYGKVSHTVVILIYSLIQLSFPGERWYACQRNPSIIIELLLRRRHRRLFVQVINEKENARFLSVIEKARNCLLSDLVQTPEDWLRHIKL
jgi:hypothetical protein